MTKATFGAGCFWGVEDAFQKAGDVTSTVVGYMGGTTESPTYEEVCTGTTGHVEVVQVEYDPSETSYEDLLSVFWGAHDPTQLNRQGPDFGTQYRSVIFFHDSEQEEVARASKQSQQDSRRFGGAIVTEISPAATFYKAEDYHQQYAEKRRSGSLLRSLLAR